MFTFEKNYFLIALVLLILEVVIALYVTDNFIRPYVGDFLVVILVYCAARTFLKAAPHVLALGVLCFAYSIEALQYMQLLRKLGLQENAFLRTVLGYGFDWMDMVAYTLGIITVLLLENRAGSLRS